MMGGLNVEKRPIGLWAKLAPEPEETVQGLLLRIAEMQMHASTDRTIKAVGVRRSAIARAKQPDINLLAEAILQDPVVIAADTPRLAAVGRRRYLLRNQVIGKHIEFGRRRLCPACIDSAPHHRFWWDVAPITSCPRHGLNLVEGCMCGKRFGWRDGSLLKCAGREDGNHGLKRTPADQKVLRKDRYLLSRFAASEVEQVPVLDAFKLEDAVHVMERIGAAAHSGYSNEWQTAGSLKEALTKIQALGFEVLADGKVDEVLTRIFDGFIAKGGRSEEGFTSCYGWLYHWFNHKGGAKFSPWLANAFLEHGARRFPIVPKAQLGKLTTAPEHRLSLKAAAARAETSVYTMKSIGLALGLIREEKRSGSQLSFSVNDVDRIAHDLNGAMNLEETRQYLGLGQRPMSVLLAEKVLVPALRGGGRLHDYVFRRCDVEAFFASIQGHTRLVREPPQNLVAIANLGRGKAATIAECILKIREGRLRVRARVNGRQGFKSLFIDLDELLKAVEGDLLSFHAAAVRMRLNARGLRRAIDGGLIRGVKKGSKTVPVNAANIFALRFMMLGEIQERLGGYLGNLRVQLKMAGFNSDPGLEKCICAGYVRSEIEPFVRNVEAGKVTLGRPEGTWKKLVKEAQKILTRVNSPLSSDDLLTKLRLMMPIGPSDQNDFFYSAMWDARETYVYIEGAGWWLRARSYLGITFLLDSTTPTQTEMVDGIVLEMLRAAEKPLSQDEIISQLKMRSIKTPIENGDVFLRRFFVRHTDKLIKLTGLGYWDRTRPYQPALYDPMSWKEKTQTAVQRTGLWIIKLVTDARRPLLRSELEPLLQEHGVISGPCTRGHFGKAVAEFANEIVYLDRVGYWLAGKAWPPVKPRLDVRPAT
jgi:hypothetical protein